MTDIHRDTFLRISESINFKENLLLSPVPCLPLPSHLVKVHAQEGGTVELSCKVDFAETFLTIFVVVCFCLHFQGYLCGCKVNFGATLCLQVLGHLASSDCTGHCCSFDTFLDFVSDIF